MHLATMAQGSRTQNLSDIEAEEVAAAAAHAELPVEPGSPPPCIELVKFDHRLTVPANASRQKGPGFGYHRRYMLSMVEYEIFLFESNICESDICELNIFDLCESAIDLIRIDQIDRI